MTKQKHKNSSFPTECIFCGKTPRTEEHLWSQWMRDISPEISRENKHFRFIEDKSTDKRPWTVVRSEPKKISGPPTSQQRKVVCKECNGGWMSRLEDQAKPILTPLILGDYIALDKHYQEVIARWAFLKTIICEYSQSDKVIIKPSEKTSFMENKIIPSNWTIWIGRIEPPSWVFEYYQTSSVVPRVLNDNNEAVQQHAKATTFVAGKLVIHVAKYTFEKDDEPIEVFPYHMHQDIFHKFVQIQPIVNNTVDLQRVGSINSAEKLLLFKSMELCLDYVDSNIRNSK